jgi:hypothetical protein
MLGLVAWILTLRRWGRACLGRAPGFRCLIPSIETAETTSVTSFWA